MVVPVFVCLCVVVIRRWRYLTARRRLWDDEPWLVYVLKHKVHVWIWTFHFLCFVFGVLYSQFSPIDNTQMKKIISEPCPESIHTLPPPPPPPSPTKIHTIALSILYLDNWIHWHLAIQLLPYIPFLDFQTLLIPSRISSHLYPYLLNRVLSIYLPDYLTHYYLAISHSRIIPK